jgi:hypothetical protein
MYICTRDAKIQIFLYYSDTRGLFNQQTLAPRAGAFNKKERALIIKKLNNLLLRRFLKQVPEQSCSAANKHAHVRSAMNLPIRFHIQNEQGQLLH